MADDKKNPREHTEKDLENATESDEKVNDAEVKDAKKKVAGKAKEKKEEEGDGESSEDEELFVPGEELSYPPALNKLGLDPHEFEALLTSKMEKLINHEKTGSSTTLGDSTEMAKKCLAIRVNIRNPKNVDKRNTIAFQFCKSLEQYVQPYLLTDPKKSPSNKQKEPRDQGGENPSKSDHNKYHLRQAELFRELKKQGKLDSPWDDNGYLLERNGVRCSIVSMCNKLDGITREYIEDYLKEQNNPAITRGQDSEAAEIDRESLENLFLLCSSIVIGRRSVDWATANDLLSVDGHKQWKEHIWALMTFAALSVVFDALSKLPKYGSESLFESYSKQANQPADQPANQPADQPADQPAS